MTPKEQAEALGITIDGRWSDKRILQEIESEKGNGMPSIETAKPEEIPDNAADKFESVEWANDHAAKIWEGQSSSLSLIERVARIRAALKDKGFNRFDALKLPTKEDFRRYL